MADVAPRLTTRPTLSSARWRRRRRGRVRHAIRLALITGRLPVIADDRVAGAIGVAGPMTGAEDRRTAELAIEKAAASP
jgi:uncharacterized protein GlcG (DUF336 family)